ncbi:nucleolar complex-associated protein-domain-containing protein [Flagelloscypha sp. PMI_526]|nr:nucleolar complex-associated protein-domain-containing protein [Flagelloscypha sp. PMI_526]
MAKTNGKLKRPAPAPKGPHKKRKLAPSTKEKAADRPTIPIPVVESDEDENISDQDFELIAEYGQSVGFLSSLDTKGIARSKKETQRLRQLSKPQKDKKTPRLKDDDLPSIHESSEDEDGLNSSISDSELDDDLPSDVSSDEEMPYEKAPRTRIREWQDPKPSKALVTGLPVKLGDGRVQATGKAVRIDSSDTEEDEDDVSLDDDEPVQLSPPPEDVSTAARFGRLAVVDVLTMSSRQSRINSAKDQIAGICQDIGADPENGTPALPDGVPNDIKIRKLAILSQLAVFKDIIPGYRIRELTEKEKTEKVSQMVQRTREYEQGLVGIYQNYLKSLEAEVKARSELAAICLQCMCVLLKDVTHFNFRINLMNCVVARLSRRSWDESSQLCLDTMIHVFKNDIVGLPSLELVQVLNRMIKERHYNVHPLVLSALFHLRLRNELGVRASNSRVEKDEMPKKNQKGKKKEVKQHLSKKAKKVLKENKEIEKEFKEAEAQVDQEERANRQTETLKLLFVLYFQILKNPKPTSLLPAALRGISKFSHMVNVDFFKDLLEVLKQLIRRETLEDGPSTSEADQVQSKLLCIVTAFDLLSGQGEVLTIDLVDFIASLYSLITPLSLDTTIDTVSSVTNKSTADLLFRALDAIFTPRSSASTNPSWRSAAFAKRLLSASMHWPGPVVVRALQFVHGLVAKDRKMEALLSTEEMAHDGVYRPEVNDPQLSNPFATCLWEVHALRLHHTDQNVRQEAEKLASYERL